MTSENTSFWKFFENCFLPRKVSNCRKRSFELAKRFLQANNIFKNKGDTFTKKVA